MGDVKKPTMSAGEKRAHSAQEAEKRTKVHERKESNRHNEANRKIRVDERKLDIMEASNQLTLEQREAHFQQQQQRLAENDAERQQRQAASDAEAARQKQIASNTKKINATTEVVKGITPGPSKNPSSLHVGSLNISLGMLFLILLFALWMGVSKAPGHTISRLAVIGKAIAGQEEIA